MRLLGLLALVLAACGSPTVHATPSAATDVDPTGAWQLASATVDGRELGLLDDQPITAVVDGSTIGGRSACNEYGGRIEIAGDGIRIVELGGTKMACGPADVMVLEQAYLVALGRVRAIEVIDGQLALRGQAVDLRFDPLPEPPVAELVDTTRVLETVFVGDGFVPSIEGDLLTLLDPGGVGLVYRAQE